MSQEELQAALTAVRGIGPWTVDMFCIFHRGLPDVLPTGDLGVRKVCVVNSKPWMRTATRPQPLWKSEAQPGITGSSLAAGSVFVPSSMHHLLRPAGPGAAVWTVAPAQPLRDGGTHCFLAALQVT